MMSPLYYAGRTKILPSALGNRPPVDRRAQPDEVTADESRGSTKCSAAFPAMRPIRLGEDGTLDKRFFSSAPTARASQPEGTERGDDIVLLERREAFARPSVVEP